MAAPQVAPKDQSAHPQHHIPPDDPAASALLASKTRLGRHPQTLQAAFDVQVHVGFSDSIAAFSCLQTLSLIQTEHYGRPVIALQDQMARLPVSLGDLTLIGSNNDIDDASVPLISNKLHLQHLTNVTNLKLECFRCACSVRRVMTHPMSSWFFTTTPAQRVLMDRLHAIASRWCCAMQASFSLGGAWPACRAVPIKPTALLHRGL